MFKAPIQLKYNQGKVFGNAGLNDSTFHRAFFNDSTVTNFGVMEARMFSSALGTSQINKPLLWLTEGQDNIYTLDPGSTEYAWVLPTDSDVIARITRVDTNLGTQPGKGGAEIFVYTDFGGFHEPVLLRTESRDQPLLRIVGHPTQVSSTEWRYTVKVQDGNPSSFVDPKYLQINMRLFDGGTSVVDEINYQYGSDYYASMSKLGGQTGNVARQITFTDKFLRRELSGQSGVPVSMSGIGGGTFSDNCFTTGYNYEVRLRGKEGNEIVKGTFVSKAEARIAERIAFDKEMMMTFGRQETFIGSNGRTGTVGAGIHQLLRESNYIPHSGNITLQEIFDAVEGVFAGRQSVGPAKIIFRTGTGGFDYINKLIAAEYGTNPLIVGSNVGNLFMRPDGTSDVPNAIEVGGQFTSIQMNNGWKIVVMYDPTKDDRTLYPELVEGKNRTLESYSFDVFDLADTDFAPKGATSKSNVAMIYDPMAKSYYSTSNVWNVDTGPVMDGSNVAAQNKEVGIFREESVGIQIWDLGRTMRFEYIQA